MSSGIHSKHLREYIIRPTLQKYNLWNPAAEELLLGTAAVESHCGEYLTQLDNGPAVGIYQMEPSTYQDVIFNVIPKFDFDFKISDDPKDMIWDFRLATLMCRLQYWRFSQPLPGSKDIPALGLYWKTYYNTLEGKGSVGSFVNCYRIYIGDF